MLNLKLLALPDAWDERSQWLLLSKSFKKQADLCRFPYKLQKGMSMADK